MSNESELIVDGHMRVLDTTVSPVLDADGTLIGTTGIARDITDRKRTEAERRHADEQVRHAQKLESLAVLAGGIAHDFNNLLAGILGSAELARRALPADSPSLVLCTEIEQSALRAAELTRQMLVYSGRGQLELRPLALSQVVDAMSESLRASVSPKIDLKLLLALDLPLVEADVTQVQQVVNNLVANASEALGDGAGVIKIRTERLEITASQLSQLEAQGELSEGVFAVIEVSDTGKGMSAETKHRMFDPFFTTKFVGRGLGLPAVLGILRGHHGAILTRTEVGRGTTVRVLFPASSMAGAPSTPIEHVSAPRDPGRAQELILVVDDEPALRRTVTRILENAGYSVVTANDGVEGLEMLENCGTSISLVIMDMVMPRLGGIEATRMIRQAMPSLPVILTSGFSGDATTDRMRDLEFTEFIEKPYRMDELVAMVRSLIGATSHQL